MLQLQNKQSAKGSLWLVEAKYLIGTGDDCDIKLARGGAVHHAQLLVDGDVVTLVRVDETATLTVNAQAVDTSVALKAGDELVIGHTAFVLIDPKQRVAARAPKPAEQPWTLKALNTALENKQFVLSGNQVIGRAKECDITLGVVHLSRKHARLSVTENGLLVEDLGSANGTYVNGAKTQRALLRSGDELSFDTLRFRVFGPKADDDETVLRRQTDDDLTTIRPAVNVSPARPGQARPQRPQRKPERPARAQPAPVQRSQPPQPLAEPASGQRALWIIVALAALAGIGYWLATH